METALKQYYIKQTFQSNTFLTTYEYNLWSFNCNEKVALKKQSIQNTLKYPIYKILI